MSKTVRTEIAMDISAKEVTKDSDKDESSKGGSTKVTMSGGGEPLGKVQKRTHSEVSETSVEELNFIHEQLDTLTSDLKETKESIKNLMTKDDIETFITKTVESVLKGMEDKIKRQVEEQVKKKVDETVTELTDRLDYMVYENGEIKDRLDKVEDQLKEEKAKTRTAIEKSNFNEQYSRKNNVKIMGVTVLDDETETNLTAKVLSIIKEKINVDIEQSEILAIHRIPSKLNPKPVLVKLKNNSVKTRLMKNRKTMKEQGHKLVDDVTKKNTELISRLLKHEKIDSAWFFNGFIYGKTTDGKRYRFDLFSDISAVISPKKDGEDGQ